MAAIKTLTGMSISVILMAPVGELVKLLAMPAVGENNFGDLNYKSWNDNTISYQRKVCSGDTTKGLDRQINEWSNQANVNVGTVSIGGNDLGFSDLVWYCIITPNTNQFGSTTRQLCIDAENKAKAMMADQVESGMKNKLKSAYLNILKKSGRDVSETCQKVDERMFTLI